ncbi:hypothetical protein ACOME3_009789 [Neoechinorhynchus agilis]
MEAFLEINSIRRTHAKLYEQITAIRNDNANIEDLTVQMTFAQMKLEALETFAKSFECSPPEGYLMWRIDNVDLKMYKSRKDPLIGFTSPPVYTGYPGYKLCVQLFFYGENDGTRSFISLYLVLLKHEFDGSLRWPFSHVVRFELIDQNQGKCNLIKSLRPDENSDAFKRPTSAMNIPFGFPRFCTHDELFERFVKEDLLFISVTIKK